MADTGTNTLKLLYRVARFKWQHGEHYLGFTSDLYFSAPSSHIFETCDNFLCWETEWIALPAHRSAAEAASISILSNGELCSGAVAANERSESATGSPVPAEDTCVSDSEESAPIYYTQQVLDELEHTAYMAEVEIIYMADCAVAEVLARIKAALPSPANYEWFYIYWDDRLTIDAWCGRLEAVGVVDNYGDVINLPRYAYLQHFTYTH